MAEIADKFDFPVGIRVNGRIQATPENELSDGFEDGVKRDQAFGEKYASGKYHLGEDWNGVDGGDTDIGLAVYAIADGTVQYADDPKDTDDIGGWGNLDAVVIRHDLPNNEHGGAVASLYGHLQNVSVTAGEDVVRGQKIGEIGDFVADAGKTDQFAHLHFELRADENLGVGIGYSSTAKPEEYIDPTSYITAHRDIGQEEGDNLLVSSSDQTIELNTWYDEIEQWFSASETRGKPVTYWALFDSGTDSQSGWFWVGGKGFQDPGETFIVSDKELREETWFGYAREAGAEDLYVAAWDGSGWSEWSGFTVTSGDYILS